MYPVGTPLSHVLILEQRAVSGATGEFSRLLHHLALGAKVVAKAVAHAGLMDDVLGDSQGANASGETQKKLDVYAHERLVHHLVHSGLIAVLGSEEDEHAIRVPDGVRRGDYVVTIDPLDGSGNIDVNLSIGTIFSIYRLPETPSDGDCTDELLLRRGDEQIAAGYVLYGPSTVLVLTTGNGVRGFTLDPLVGEFLLTHPDIRIPERGATYAINEGNAANWLPWTRDYVASLKGSGNGAGKAYGLRYVGCLVGDIHRTLLKGGIFLYPGDRKSPRGKLRLVYEGFPMAFLIEQAGGRATDGVRRILDYTAEALHQRVPLVLGSPRDVEEAAQFASAGLEVA